MSFFNLNIATTAKTRTINDGIAVTKYGANEKVHSLYHVYKNEKIKQKMINKEQKIIAPLKTESKQHENATRNAIAKINETTF